LVSTTCEPRDSGAFIPKYCGEENHKLSVRDHAIVVDTLRAIHLETDNVYSKARVFRNVLYGATAVLVAVVGVLIIVGVIKPFALPLCAPESASDKVCISGKAYPSGGDILLTLFFGAIGASLSTIATISRLGPFLDPHGTALAQALVKVPTGAVTAVIGTLVTTGGGWYVTIGVPGKQAGIILVAFLFGYAQQLLTRVADQKGQEIRVGLARTTGEHYSKLD
jgi:hypothetical protein